MKYALVIIHINMIKKKTNCYYNSNYNYTFYIIWNKYPFLVFISNLITYILLYKKKLIIGLILEQ